MLIDEMYSSFAFSGSAIAVFAASCTIASLSTANATVACLVRHSSSDVGTVGARTYLSLIKLVDPVKHWFLSDCTSGENLWSSRLVILWFCYPDVDLG